MNIGSQLLDSLREIRRFSYCDRIRFSALPHANGNSVRTQIPLIYGKLLDQSTVALNQVAAHYGLSFKATPLKKLAPSPAPQPFQRTIEGLLFTLETERPLLRSLIDRVTADSSLPLRARNRMTRNLKLVDKHLVHLINSLRSLVNQRVLKKAA